jgi:hypothetical protein
VLVPDRASGVNECDSDNDREEDFVSDRNDDRESEKVRDNVGEPRVAEGEVVLDNTFV